MCLKTSQTFPEYAKEDIVCYKIIHKEMYGEEIKWVSPYHGDYVWFRGEINNELIQRMTHKASFSWYDRINDNKLDLNGNREINAGFFHVFELLEDAIKMKLNISRKNEYKIFKCIIPKGTKYYKGYFSMVNPYTGYGIVCTNFASEKLKLVEICA